MIPTTTDLQNWAREEDHASFAQERRRASLWKIASALALGALAVVLCGATKSNVALSENTPDFMLHLKGKKSESPYKATQFVSFTVNTMGGIAKHGECIGREVAADGTCYLGSFDIVEDVVHRASIVKGVLDILKDDKNKKHPDIDHRDDGKCEKRMRSLPHDKHSLRPSLHSAENLCNARILLERPIWSLYSGSD
jgi:hypothetical protein